MNLASTRSDQLTQYWLTYALYKAFKEYKQLRQYERLKGTFYMLLSAVLMDVVMIHKYQLRMSKIYSLSSTLRHHWGYTLAKDPCLSLGHHADDAVFSSIQ